MEQKNFILLLKKVLMYCLGLFLMAMGVSFSVKSNLGVSPVNSIPYVVSLITGIEQGKCVTAIFISFIAIQILILMKEFKVKNLLQIIGSTIFGYFVTATNAMTTGIPYCTSYPMQLLFLFISMVFVAIGVSLYLKPNLLSLPAEGVMMALVQKFGIKFPNAKTGCDTAMVVIAAIISLLFFHELRGVREGTLIAAIGIGQLVKVWNKFADQKMSAFLE